MTLLPKQSACKKLQGYLGKPGPLEPCRLPVTCSEVLRAVCVSAAEALAAGGGGVAITAGGGVATGGLATVSIEVTSNGHCQQNRCS